MSIMLIILAHPSPKSFNHAVASVVRERLERLGHSVRLHDLYTERFDPVLSHAELRRRISFDDLVQRHYHDLEAAHGIIVVHPEWWSQPPAVLKGWLDRVLRPGIGYEFAGEEFMPKNKVSLLGGKKALVLATTDSEQDGSTGIAAAREDSAPGGSAADSGGARSGEPLLCALWRSTFSYCGIDDFHFRMLYNMHASEAADRREWLARMADLAAELFPPAPDEGQ